MLKCKNNISVVVITHNEENQIAGCISSCKVFSEDVIVVDSGSIDRTTEIAQNLGAKCFTKPWEGYGAARNFGADMTTYDWILSIDADERPDDEMSRSLCEIQLNQQHIYGFRRINHIGSVAIKHGDWNPDIKFRLYHRETTRWNNQKVHENLHIEKWQTRTILPGHIMHYSYADVESLQKRLDHYARLGAAEMYSQKQKAGLISKLKPWFKYFRSYYLKGGFKDGKLGHQIAKANAEALRRKYAYLSEIKEKQ
ncbi:glycosyltransferase family 2 protein [Portibacter marinus]|uniref:glycosyltransferase family 2 protein n=1 Tax=Portibacter marinus TaxID=2898660 RepID=UPI001F1D21C4|nr:glycosyltransferase family 2 protein [Portibacter marinus]